MRIGRSRIGPGQPLFVIAEIGLNHGGSIERALQLVDAAAVAGASAVKLQTLVAAELVAPSCPAPAHVQAASLREFFAAFELDEAAHHAIAARARAHGLALIATPFSEGAVDLLERVGVDAYKIASGDLTWTGLIERCAQTGKPLILSSGMATLDEVDHAVASARAAGTGDVAVLHCVSAYPVPHGSEHLKAIATLGSTLGVAVGLSDHGADTFAIPIAVALGATLYERHLMLTDDDDAIDAAVSSTPAELAAAIAVAARTVSALGSAQKQCVPAEAVNLRASRRGLYAARLLHPGDIISQDDVIALRPASDVAPDDQALLVGTRLTRRIAAGEPFLLSDLSGTGDQRSSSKGRRDVA